MSRRSFSPAGLILARAGITQRTVAQRLGSSRSAVSMYLRGDRPPHPRLIETIRKLAGSKAADEIAVILGVDQ